MDSVELLATIHRNETNPLSGSTINNLVDIFRDLANKLFGSTSISIIKDIYLLSSDQKLVEIRLRVKYGIIFTAEYNFLCSRVENTRNASWRPIGAVTMRKLVKEMMAVEVLTLPVPLYKQDQILLVPISGEH